jgi:glycosyltransferase involved in cell wall biosynthesis
MQPNSPSFRNDPTGGRPAAALWVDVTTLLTWRGVFTGIPRTLSSLLGVWLSDEALNLRPCQFDDDGRYFVAVPRDELVRVLSAAHEAERLGRRPAEPAPPPRPRLRARVRRALRPVGRLLPAELRGVYHDLRSALGRVVRLGLRAAGAFRAPPRPEPAPPAAPFAAGDVLLAACGGWDHPGYCEAIAAARADDGVRVVPVIYDVIPCLMPHLFPPELPPLFRAWADRLLRAADLVLTISKHSRADVQRWAARLGVHPPPPVEVLRLGVEVGGAGKPVRPAGLPWDGARPFVLSVGTLEVRKNHALLYHAWRRLIAEHGNRVPPLVIAGAPGWLTGDLVAQLQRDPLVRGRVVHLASVTNDELRFLYERCLFGLYPSLYEGWGLPVAECLAHGKYCISSDATSLPEIAGDLIDYHDPLDLPGCVRLVRRALFEDGYVAAREERIRREYHSAGWRDCAARALALMEVCGAERCEAPRGLVA